MHISAPGKLFLSGEWAILETGNSGIVAAVNKRVHVEIEKSKEISVSVDDFNIKNVKAEYRCGKIEWLNVNEEQKEKLVFMKGALEAAMNYLGDNKSYKIRSWGEESQIEVDGKKKKIGFGSSAASVVAAVAGVLAVNNIDITKRKNKDIIYKLSAIAHYLAQGKIGSGFDIAASTYGGIFVYKRFDPKWLEDQIKEKTIKEDAETKWTGFVVEELKIPEDFQLLIGWTKTSASTTDMIKQMNVFKTQNPENYKKLISKISDIAAESEKSWKQNNKKEILKLIQENEKALAALGKESGVNIETPDLKKLSDIANKNGGAGKLSGAGGGDCGIGVCYRKKTADKIKQEWKKAGIWVLDAEIDNDGIVVY